MDKQVERIIYVLGGAGNIVRVYEDHGVFVDIYKKELVKEKYLAVAGIHTMIGGGDLRHLLFYHLNINNEQKEELETIIWSLSENKELLNELDMLIKEKSR